MTSKIRDGCGTSRWTALFLKVAIVTACYTLTPHSSFAATELDSKDSGSTPELQRQRQREIYVEAREKLAKGDIKRFEKLSDQLKDYPLHPYLIYAGVISRLASSSTVEIAQILQQYNDLAFASRLRYDWLSRLAARKRWQEFEEIYSANISSASLQCHHAFALYQTGRKDEAIEQGLKLWQVGQSQPKQCDPIFSILIDNQRISNEIAWVRFSNSLFNHEYGLANYALKFITEPAIKGRAQHYLKVDRDPRLIAKYADFQTGHQEEIEILVHGLTHLASIDASTALKHWNRYNQSHDFNEQEQGKVVSALVKSLYQQNEVSAADNYLLQSKSLVADDLLEWRLRELVKEADWQAVITWYRQLGERVVEDDRWNYWYARSIELSGGDDATSTKEIYRAIADERSFYGFLASEWLKSPYELNHQPVKVSEEEINTLAQSPAFLRIRELYYQDELAWARREWQHTLQGAPQKTWLTAAKIAERWQWHNQAIMTMIQTGYWNDIDVRFPQAHKEAFLSEAKATNIPPNLLLALSRQESAFNDRVTSPAGAKGLMQLMPATARETARKNNIVYSSPNELFDPDKNILIGSRYYKQMLDKFNNNRILATAAYNAGPARVYRWQRESQGTLPFDAWIEVIPFRETRNYVQNVLAFSIIYAHHMGLDVGILSPEEKNTLL